MGGEAPKNDGQLWTDKTAGNRKVRNKIEQEKNDKASSAKSRQWSPWSP